MIGCTITIAKGCTITPPLRPAPCLSIIHASEGGRAKNTALGEGVGTFTVIL